MDPPIGVRGHYTQRFVFFVHKFDEWRSWCSCEKKYKSIAINNKSLNWCVPYLPSGVPIDVAGHEPPSLSVLGSTLGLLEGGARPSGLCCHPIAVLAYLFRACPRPCPQVDLFAGSHVAWHAQKMTAFSSLPFQTATFWYLQYESLPRITIHYGVFNMKDDSINAHLWKAYRIVIKSEEIYSI